MKNEYRLQLYKNSYGMSEFDFVCTESQINKVFYALVFACSNSSISCARLYRSHRDKRTNNNVYVLLNQFTAQSAQQSLTNFVAERVLMPLEER